MIEVDGGWRTENNYSECNATCGNGFKSKKKFCDRPEPKNNGRFCHCNQSDTAEDTCDGSVATIIEPCHTKCTTTMQSKSKTITHFLILLCHISHYVEK